MFTPDDIPYTPEERICEAKEGDMYLVLAPELPNCVSVNAVGKDIIDLCDGTRTVRDITELLSSKTGEDPEENLPKILYFLNYLESKKFAFKEPVITPPFSPKVPHDLSSLWLNVTYACNLRCHHCHSSFGNPLEHELTTEELARIVEDASQFSNCTLIISGGEPLLRDDIDEILKAASHYFGDRVLLITNGTLIDEEKAQLLADLGIMVQVSLEGPDVESNDAVRGAGVFKRTLNGVRKLRSKGITPIGRMTLLKTNIDRIDEIAEFGRREGFNPIGFGILQKSGRAYNRIKDMEPTPQDLIRAFRRIREIDPDLEYLRFEESLKPGVTRLEKIDLCSAGTEILSIAPDGGVYPCSALMYPEFLAGNVTREPLNRIWKESPVLQEIRSLSVSKIPGCSECPIRYLCGGGCLVDIYWEHQSLQGKTPHCEFLYTIKWEELKQTRYKTETVQ